MSETTTRHPLVDFVLLALDMACDNGHDMGRQGEQVEEYAVSAIASEIMIGDDDAHCEGYFEQYDKADELVTHPRRDLKAALPQALSEFYRAAGPHDPMCGLEGVLCPTCRGE